MTELLTAAQMRAIEQAAIESGEVTGLELMERAGRGVVEAIFEEWPELAKTSHRAVVLCGPGNNGGDGFVVARLLKEWGWAVEVFLYGAPEKLPPDARTNYERWAEMGTTAPLSECDATINRWFPNDPPIIVDAVFGTGLTRELPVEVKKVFWISNAQSADERKRVSIDLPSGICSDSGRVLGIPGEAGSAEIDGQVFQADLTVTFAKKRRGHVLSRGPEFSEKIAVIDIGVSERKYLPWEMSGDWSEVVENLSDWQDALLERVGKYPDDHKYTHGHALILAGGPGKGGAARLAARGALRIGAGLVTVGCPPDAVAENAAQLNAIMSHAVPSDEDLALFLAADERVNAVCLGPGIGTGARERDLVDHVLGTGRKTVLDADALTLIAADQDLFSKLHADCILTPHAGEFARLFPDVAEKLNAPATKGPAYSKVDATREAAARAGCVVLFKGPDTVIAAPDGRCSINSAHYDRAAPWLATAGSGDVLAGFITGLLARRFEPMQAAETAAWLHVACARKFGPGLIAEDLPEQLPAVFRDLGL